MGLMSTVTKLIGGSAGHLVKDLADVAGQFITTDQEKRQFEIEAERLLQKRDSEVEQTIRSELSAKESIIVAEMNQGDKYTKRARPTVVYYGLVMITVDLLARFACMVFDFVPAKDIPSSFLPTEFWIAWGGIVSTWVVGRSAEKRGIRNKVVGLITGNKGLGLID